MQQFDDFWRHFESAHATLGNFQQTDIVGNSPQQSDYTLQHRATATMHRETLRLVVTDHLQSQQPRRRGHGLWSWTGLPSCAGPSAGLSGADSPAGRTDTAHSRRRTLARAGHTTDLAKGARQDRRNLTDQTAQMLTERRGPASLARSLGERFDR